MSFERPTLTQLAERAKNDLDARLTGADSRLRRSVLGTLATVQAGMTHGLHGHLDYLARQLLPDTAEDEFLLRWASILKLTRNPATLAGGPVTLTGVDGTVIDAGEVLQRRGGQEFVTTESATILDGTATVAVVALEPGPGGLAEAGTSLSLVSPIAGVASAAVVAAGGLTGGVDEEALEQLRERVLVRLGQTPEGGALHDYYNWAREVPEVVRVWPRRNWMGAGTVGILFTMDGRPDPIPTEEDIEAVFDWVSVKAPTTAELIVVAPTPKPLNLVIHGLTPDDPVVRAAVDAEIDDLLYRVGFPGGTVLISQLREAISIAAGEQDHELVSPVDNIVHAAHELPVRGVTDWGD